MRGSLERTSLIKHMTNSRIKIGKGRKESTETWERGMRKEAIAKALMRAKNQRAKRKNLKSVIGRGRIFQKKNEKSKERDAKRTLRLELTKRFHVMDVSGKAMDQNTAAVEHKKQKEHHSWKQTQSLKIMDKEAKSGKKEEDSYNKESDTGYVEVGGTGKERDALSYGVQQLRGCYAPREVHKWEIVICSPSPKHRKMKGKPEVSATTYKVGECLNVWFPYEGSDSDPIPIPMSCPMDTGMRAKLKSPENIRTTDPGREGLKIGRSDAASHLGAGKPEEGHATA
ncbi:hypothetical protein AgCh_037450 [Apium graveolens]